MLFTHLSNLPFLCLSVGCRATQSVDCGGGFGKCTGSHCVTFLITIYLFLLKMSTVPYGKFNNHLSSRGGLLQSLGEGVNYFINSLLIKGPFVNIIHYTIAKTSVLCAYIYNTCKHMYVCMCICCSNCFCIRM